MANRDSPERPVQPSLTNAVLLPGGGARGAYQVGVLRAISQMRADQTKNPFPIIVGTSAGAINAGVIATHAHEFSHGIERLAGFWDAMHCDRIYRTDWSTVGKSAARWVGAMMLGRLGVESPRSLLDTRPLLDLLTNQLRFDLLPTAFQSGALSALAVTASGYTTSRAITFCQSADPTRFKPWGRPRREGRAGVIDARHLMASAALPLLFPPRMIGAEAFGDGGLRQTAPLSPAIHLGADRILVISTRDGVPDSEPHTLPTRPELPSIGDVAGYMLDIVFMDSLDADIHRLERVNETLSHIPTEAHAQSPLRPIECIVVRPSEDIRDIASRHLDLMPSSVKTLLTGLGAWGPKSRLPSYLLFESIYCRELMELGYRDAMAMRDQLSVLTA